MIAVPHPYLNTMKQLLLTQVALGTSSYQTPLV
jgi:hypothetical protein